MQSEARDAFAQVTPEQILPTLPYNPTSAEPRDCEAKIPADPPSSGGSRDELLRLAQTGTTSPFIRMSTQIGDHDNVELHEQTLAAL